VGGVLGPIAVSVALVLGRPDGTGRLRVVGRTGTISRDVRPALGAVLRPATEGHPWPAVLPPARFGNVGPVEYTRVKPSVVVELAVDAAVDIIRGRAVWRHVAQFQRLRMDLQADDLYCDPPG
jgi:hypothetical protein